MLRTVEITIEDGYEIEGDSIQEIEGKAYQQAQEEYGNVAYLEVNVVDDNTQRILDDD